MNKFSRALAAVAAVGLSHTAAYASPVTLNTGVDYNGDGSTQTSAANSLGFTGSLSTSVFIGNPLAAGTTVITTNNSTVLNANGFATTATTNILGGALDTPASDNKPKSASRAQLNIDDVNSDVDPFDYNGFVNGVNPATAYNASLGGSSWALTYDYVLNGKVNSNGFIDYTSGSFNIFYNAKDAGGSAVTLKVLELDLFTASNQVNNLPLSGKLDFGFLTSLSAADQTFVKNFWQDAQPGGTSFYDKWMADPVAITWYMNTNENPAKIKVDQLFTGKPESSNIFRQTAWNGEFSFNVPEPGSIALVGLALTGLAFASRRKKA